MSLQKSPQSKLCSDDGKGFLMRKKTTDTTERKKKKKSKDIAVTLKIAGQEAETQTLEERSIAKTVEAFLLEVDALADTLPLVTPLIEKSMATALKDLFIFLTTKCRKTDENYSVPHDLYSDLLT